MKRSARLGVLIGACVLACVAMASRAQADSITFTYNCLIVSAATCNPGGPFGTLTLTDSSIDPNRVDLSLILNGSNPNGAITGISQFFLNYDGSQSLTGRRFALVSVLMPNGVNDSTVLNGATPVFTSDSEGPPSGTNTLDIRLDPTLNTLIYTGSLVLKLNQAPTSAEFNLDVSMFNLTSPVSGLYSAVTTVPLGTSLDAGATIATVVPEPATMFLGGLGLIAFGYAARRRLFGR